MRNSKYAYGRRQFWNKVFGEEGKKVALGNGSFVNFGHRVKYPNILNKVNKETKFQLGTNRAIFGGLAAETAYDILGDDVEKYALGGQVNETDPETKKPLTDKELRAKYKTNPYFKGRETWATDLDKEFAPTKEKVKDSLYAAAKLSGISPSLLYSSSMEEGMGLGIHKPDNVSEAYAMWAEKDKDASKYPVDGFYNYGLDTFGNIYEDLLKKGYLPEGFDKKFKVFEAINEKNESVKPAAFISNADALTAKAAMIKDVSNQLENYLVKNKITLDDKGKEFFTLAGYNGGVGNMQKMIASYNKKGYLKDNKYLSSDFTPASYAPIYTNVQRRLQNKNILDAEGYFSDYEPITNEVVQNQQSNMINIKKPKMANGGVAGIIANNARPLLDGIMALLEGNSQYSNQPIVNASTMRNMATPYSNFAMGGTVDDYSEDELMELQLQADEMGITIEELLEQLNSGEEDEDPFAMLDEEEYVEDEVEEEYSGADYYAMGGNVPIEVEGEEIVESPNGNIKKVVGPKHEQGGIDINVPKGTNIYSDRLSVDGKTMADRKLNREKRLAKLFKLEEDSTNNLSKNTIKRTSQIIEMEEEKDMAMQEIANQIYGEVGEAAYGFNGESQPNYIQRPNIAQQYNNLEGFDADAYLRRWGKYAPKGYGQILHPNPLFDIEGNFRLSKEEEKISVMPKPFELNDNKIVGNTTNTNTTKQLTPINPISLTNPNNVGKGYWDMPETTPIISPTEAAKNVGADNDIDVDEEGNMLGVGDYLGMAGNLFGAIAPIVNTRNAARNTIPNINRFRGFGRKALETNQAAQNYADTMKTNSKIALKSNTNSAIGRNRNSARNINTLRALDIASNMEANRAENDIDNSFSGQMLNLLGQQGQLENQQNLMEMRGQTEVDIRDQMDRDAYYTNMGQNLAGVATNVQRLGRNLNIARSNKDDLDIMALLTENGIRLGRNKKGKWEIKNN